MNIDKSIIEKVMDEVRISEILEEIPVGAVVFNSDDQSIISTGHNTRQRDHNVIGHAEVNAILKAENIIGDWRLDGYSMIVSLKPCKMCSEIIKESRLDHIYFLLDSNYYSKSTYDYVLLEGYEEYKKILDEKLKIFFHKKR